MKYGDNLEGYRLRPIHKGIAAIAGERPEEHRARCEMGAGMSAPGALCNQGAGFENRLFYTISGGFTIGGNVTPDVKYVGFGKRGQSVTAHRLDKRRSSFRAWISRRACSPSISSPRSAWR